MLFICYPKCATCQKARTWLAENKISYTERDITMENPTLEELKKWHKLSGIPLKRFFNTSGLEYRKLGLRDKLWAMTEEEQYTILSSSGMIVKRPIVVSEDLVLVGFKPIEWEKKLQIQLHSGGTT